MSLAAFFAILNVLPWTIGGGIGIACIFKEFGCHKRDLAGQAEMPMLFQWNNTELRGKDIAQLNELTVSFRGFPNGEAVFRNSMFSANGSLTLQDTMNGILHGGVSFPIPGLEQPVEGLWIALDQIEADVKTALAFGQMQRAVKEAQEGEVKSLLETFMELAKTFNP